MKSICMLLALSCSALGRPQLPHGFLGALQPTQLPPLRVDEVEDQAGFEARTYQSGYRLHNTGYRAPPDAHQTAAPVGYSTQVPPIRSNEAEEQGGRYDNGRYQTTGYRLQNTQQTYGSTAYQDYTGQYRPQAVDYRASTPKDVVPILAYSNDVAYDGSYNYNYETADGTSRQESGVMVGGADDEGAGPSVRGSYSYTAPDGQLITVHYVADKDGFRAEGAHLPTPPPMPEAIAKSLEFIARARSSQPVGYEDDGQYHPERSFGNQDLYSS